MRSWVVRRVGGLALACAALISCSTEQAAAPLPASAENARSSALAGDVPHVSSAPVDNRPRVVALGDSLTAGLGLSPDEAYPALLQRRIDEEGLNYQVVNAGVSGDTTAGGLSRTDLALEGDVRVLILALGGNDALRGLLVGELQRNLSRIIERAKAKGVSVVLAGMEAPPNFGPVYTVSFHKVYPELAKTYDVPLVPFLLEGVAGIDSLNQRDQLHPNVEGTRIVADNVWKVLEPVLKKESK